MEGIYLPLERWVRLEVLTRSLYEGLAVPVPKKITDIYRKPLELSEESLKTPELLEYLRMSC